MARESSKPGAESDHQGDIASPRGPDVSSTGSVRGVGRTSRLLAALASVAMACESGEAMNNAGADAGHSDSSNEVASLSEIQVMADHNGVELFGNSKKRLDVTLKLVGKNGDILDVKKLLLGPGFFKTDWNYAGKGGELVEMTGQDGKGMVYNLDAGSTGIPEMPKK